MSKTSQIEKPIYLHITFIIRKRQLVYRAILMPVKYGQIPAV